MTRETQITFGVRANVADSGVWCMRNNTGFDADRRVHYGLGLGGADLIAIQHGRFIGLEVKSARGKLAENQSLWATGVRKAGAFATVIRSPDVVSEALARAALCICPHCNMTIIPRWRHEQ